MKTKLKIYKIAGKQLTENPNQEFAIIDKKGVTHLFRTKAQASSALAGMKTKKKSVKKKK